MEIYGDSLSAGLLDNQPLEKAISFEELRKIYTALGRYKFTGEVKHLVDFQKPELAWPALVARELGTENMPLETRNFARSGAKTKDLYKQIDKTPSEETIAFFFIGHNDICNHTESVERLSLKYEREIEQALRLWDAGHQRSTAYLIPVGMIPDVYKALAGTKWSTVEGDQFQCEDSWTKHFPYCVSHYRMYAEGRLDSHLRPRITGMNDTLATIARRWNTNSRRNTYDVLSLRTESLRPSHFAIDCFHLSAGGQQALGAAIGAAVLAY